MASVARPHFEYWWQALLAVPSARRSGAYDRLARIFRDQTRPTKTGFRPGAKGHEFTDPSSETHLTVALWENFVLYSPTHWLPLLWRESGLSAPLGRVSRCNWSYQWAEHGKAGARHCDIVLQYEDSLGTGILVVEAKRPGGSLSEKDLDPAYYLSIPDLAAFKRRSIVYLLDEATRQKDAGRIRAHGHDVGHLSWVQLADVQLSATQSLQVSDEMRSFVAASLHRLYVQSGIEPSNPPLPYLAAEPSSEEVVTKSSGIPLGTADWPRKLWLLRSEDGAA